MEIILTDNQIISETVNSTSVDTQLLGIGQNERVDLFFTITSPAVEFGYGENEETTENKYTFYAIESSSADMDSHTVVNQTYTSFIPASALVDGFEINLPMAPGSRIDRYISARYEVNGVQTSVGVTCILKTMAD